MESAMQSATAKVFLPVRIFRGIRKGIGHALGQLATRSFWKKLISAAITEMVAAFMKTLGGKFLTYGITREDPETKKAAQGVNSTTANAAFSNGYQPRTSYNNGYNQQPVDSPFPGFR